MHEEIDLVSQPKSSFWKLSIPIIVFLYFLCNLWYCWYAVGFTNRHRGILSKWCKNTMTSSRSWMNWSWVIPLWIVIYWVSFVMIIDFNIFFVWVFVIQCTFSFFWVHLFLYFFLICITYNGKFVVSFVFHGCLFNVSCCFLNVVDFCGRYYFSNALWVSLYNNGA